MITRHGRANFKNFQSLLESGCSSKIVMGGLVEKLFLETDDVMQWHTQAGNITNNYKVNVDFAVPTLNAKNVVAGNFRVDGSAMGRNAMILGRYR